MKYFVVFTWMTFGRGGEIYQNELKNDESWSSHSFFALFFSYFAKGYVQIKIIIIIHKQMHVRCVHITCWTLSTQYVLFNVHLFLPRLLLVLIITNFQKLLKIIVLISRQFVLVRWLLHYHSLHASKNIFCSFIRQKKQPLIDYIVHLLFSVPILLCM